MSVKRTLGLTRRSLLRGAATAGAAGLAVTALAAGPAEAETTRHPGPDRQRDLEVHHEFDDRPAEPITVHIRDHRSGEIDVFWGTEHTRLHDRDLASRIAGSARLPRLPFAVCSAASFRPDPSEVSPCHRTARPRRSPRTRWPTAPTCTRS